MARSLLLVFLIYFTVFAGLTYQGETAEFSPKNTFYQIEYLKPVSGDISFIYIIFSAAVSSDLAERFLRQEIDRASNYSSPRGVIMAYALVQTSSNSAEDMVKLPDGSNFLIYANDTKEILTEKEHHIAQRPKAKSGKAIQVVIDINLQKNSAGKIRVVAETNLPDNMQMMVGLRNRAIGFFAQDFKVSVDRGNFESNWFSNKGKALPSGTYEISISSPITDLQPDSVKRVIGNKGENLVGNMIISEFGSNRIDMKVKKQID